jgi:hypothetical protein
MTSDLVTSNVRVQLMFRSCADAVPAGSHSEPDFEAAVDTEASMQRLRAANEGASEVMLYAPHFEWH